MSVSLKGRAWLVAGALLLAAAPAHALDLNAYRAAHKLPKLAFSTTLSGAARAHAQDMAKRNHLDHDGFHERARLSRGAAAENVSYGCDTQACAVKQWSESAGHRENMLMKGISLYGIGWAVSESGRKYWVMELGN